jgi:hypothetical protein
LVCPKNLANNNCIFSDPEQKFCFDLKKLGGKKSVTVSSTFMLGSTIKLAIY